MGHTYAPVNNRTGAFIYSGYWEPRVVVPVSPRLGDYNVEITLSQPRDVGFLTQNTPGKKTGIFAAASGL